MIRVFKVLHEDGRAFHGGSGSWPLPRGDKPGAWMSVDGPLDPCHNGLHLCRTADLPRWLGPAIYEAEYEGEVVDAGDKLVVRKARLLRRLPWDEKSQRLFAADCAARALRLQNAPDPRSLNAVKVARLFARGKATQGELEAAGSAAERAAWTARGTKAWTAAESSTWVTMRPVAMWAAMGATMINPTWTGKRLLHYLDA